MIEADITMISECVSQCVVSSQNNPILGEEAEQLLGEWDEVLKKRAVTRGGALLAHYFLLRALAVEIEQERKADLAGEPGQKYVM